MPLFDGRYWRGCGGGFGRELTERCTSEPGLQIVLQPDQRESERDRLEVFADREVKAQNPDAWAVLLDVNGNLAEGQGSNIFLVRDRGLATRREHFVLPGVSRQATIDLARQLRIPFEEKDVDLYDAYTADECFLTSTSLCICGVRSLNGRRFGAGQCQVRSPTG